MSTAAAAPPGLDHHRAPRPGHHGDHLAASEPMTHGQVMRALSGLLLGLFVAILSSTVVSNALPIIVPALGGSESGYTWVVTAALLAVTVTTPIWGKLSDLFSKKALVQTALVIYVAGSLVAGLSQDMAMLITCRVVQGIGAGGLTALTQVILASMVSPRERGRYSGYLGATFALATVGGPLIGGVVTDHLSWHWCFYVGVPFAVIAFFVLQATLHLPVVTREAKIDYLGAVLISTGVSALLIWVSLAGQQFAWGSWWTVGLVAGGVVLLALAVLAESRAAQPIVPLRLFRRPTVTLSALASLFVGVALFSGTVFLSEYFQLGRGESPTRAGVLTMPLIIGLALSSTVAGQVITRTGRWKAWLVVGGVLLTAGAGWMSTVEWDTDYWAVAGAMALMGLGLGMMMQNLVLAVQNVVEPAELGTASSLIAFARTLGGAIGVSALGALLNHRVSHALLAHLAAAGIDPRRAAALDSGIVPDLSTIAQPVRRYVQESFGSAVGDVFLVAAPCALVALVITLFFKEVALRGSTASAPADGVQSADPADVERGAVEATGAVVADAVEQVAAEQDAAEQDAAERDAAERDAVDAPRAPTGRTDTGLGLSGTVRHLGGRVLEGAVVTVADATGAQVGRTSTGPDGRYALPLPTGGSYLLIVAAPRVQPWAGAVAVADAPVVRDVDLAGTASVTGRVERSAGTGVVVGVPAALVTLTDARGDVVGSTTTDAEGAYAFPQLAGGTYVLTAQSPAHRPVARALLVPDTGSVGADLRLAGGGRLLGTVAAASDGAGVREASVTLVDADGAVVASATTDGAGGYAFDDLAAGSYTLTATGYAPVATTVRVAEDDAARADVELGAAR